MSIAYKVGSTDKDIITAGVDKYVQGLYEIKTTKLDENLDINSTTTDLI